MILLFKKELELVDGRGGGCHFLVHFLGIKGILYGYMSCLEGMFNGYRQVRF
jgi:hypothetical protein